FQPSRKRPAPTHEVPERYNRRPALVGCPAALRNFDARSWSSACIAEFGSFGFGIGRSGRFAFAILLEPGGAPRRVGGGLRSGLLEVRWIVDHRRKVALVRATDIVVRLVFVIATVQNRGPKVLWPQTAGPRHGRNPRIAEPDRRERSRIVRMVLMQLRAAWRNAACGQQRLNFLE